MSLNKSRPLDPDRVLHMVEATCWLIEQTADLTITDLLADKTMQLAMERQFEILGEAASHVSATTKQHYSAIDWRRIKDFRNLIAHEYFRVDYAQLLYTAQSIIPALLPLLESLLADLDQQFGPDASV